MGCLYITGSTPSCSTPAAAPAERLLLLVLILQLILLMMILQLLLLLLCEASRDPCARVALLRPSGFLREAGLEPQGDRQSVQSLRLPAAACMQRWGFCGKPQFELCLRSQSLFCLPGLVIAMCPSCHFPYHNFGVSFHLDCPEPQTPICPAVRSVCASLSLCHVLSAPHFPSVSL